MRKQAVSLAALSALIVTLACNGTEPGVLDPTPLATASVPGASLAPSAVAVQPVANALCPAVPPFVGSLDLFIQAPAVDVRLNSVRMTFTDAGGLTAPSVTLPAPVLTTQFGSTLIEARARRAFPFSFPFGCFGRRAGTLVIVVVLVDGTGQEQILETRAAVR